jgi:hypothetical protein
LAAAPAPAAPAAPDAPAAPAAPSHVASCFDNNGWRYLIGIVKDSKDNIL